MISDLLKDFVSLIFPNFCETCGCILKEYETYLCNTCLLQLPHTHFEQEEKNPVAQMFWGRVPVEQACAIFFFLQKGRIQNLLHKLKYQSQKEIGHFLGKTCAKAVEKSSYYQGLDYIIPVPLHPDKQRKRTYNQSEVLAKGMAKILKIPLCTDCLLRIKPTQTQTKKARYARWANTADAFLLQAEDRLINSKILLVDDVVTTGATLENCASLLAQIPGIKIFICCVAVPMR